MVGQFSSNRTPKSGQRRVRALLVFNGARRRKENHARARWPRARGVNRNERSIPCDCTQAKLPFHLPHRPQVTRIRQRDLRELRGTPKGDRTQEMAGFEPRFTDIVDYIVRITDEIWIDRAVGSIYDTYDHACTIYSHYGVVRSVEEVVTSTVSTLNAFPDGKLSHLCVAWDGNDEKGFYTSHLGFSRSTNLGRSTLVPLPVDAWSLHFAADCISRKNRIHTEWLVRDNGALVRQLGLNLDEVARELGQTAANESFVPSTGTHYHQSWRASRIRESGIPSMGTSPISFTMFGTGSDLTGCPLITLPGPSCILAEPCRKGLTQHWCAGACDNGCHSRRRNARGKCLLVR